MLVIGAGITGLTLAQALRKNGIPYTVFERDPDPFYRGKGWALTIQWALDAFLSLLPQELIDQIPETYVDPIAVANGEEGNSLFFNLRNGEAKWRVPPARRFRVSREKVRRLLMDGIDIQVRGASAQWRQIKTASAYLINNQWNKSLASINQPSEHTIQALFTDGTSAAGNLLVGCDGSHSITRKLLCQAGGSTVSSENQRLGARILGVSVAYLPHLAGKMRAIDPYYLQGGDPETDTHFWFSLLESPNNNDGEHSGTYECQVLISWPYKAGYRGLPTPLEVPKSNKERLALMRSLAEDWVEPFREIVQSIPDEVEAKAIALEDWPTPDKGSWSNFNGKATLVGDAAHTMTMCEFPLFQKIKRRNSCFSPR